MGSFKFKLWALLISLRMKTTAATVRDGETPVLSYWLPSDLPLVWVTSGDSLTFAPNMVVHSSSCLTLFACSSWVSLSSYLSSPSDSSSREEILVCSEVSTRDLLESV